jgi:hypothetical protein
MPNLDALAHRYAVAGNLFGDAGDADFERDAAADPENYPRAGYLFNNLARHHLSFRDYGAPAEIAADPPALASTASADDAGRAREFMRDYGGLVRAHRQPRYTRIRLSGLGTDAADVDRALGTIVDYLSHLPSWKATAIFVLPDTEPSLPDRLDADRSYAIVISPYAKPHYVGMRHLSAASVLKTTDQILGLPPLALGDLLATDMSDFFRPQHDLLPFTALAE